MKEKDRFSMYCDSMIATGGLTDSVLDMLFYAAQAEVLWRIDEVCLEIKKKEMQREQEFKIRIVYREYPLTPKDCFPSNPSL